VARLGNRDTIPPWLKPKSVPKSKPALNASSEGIPGRDTLSAACDSGDGGGGGGGDGGTDASGRPFFDPGFGSPAQNIQTNPTGGRVEPVTTQPLTDPTGGRVQAVTVENLPAPEPFDFGFDPALTADGGFGFFNQGGLVSLLPRRATPVRSPPISYRRY